MKPPLAALGLILLLAGAAPADEPAPASTPAPGEELSLESFGASHPACLEWNDGCATCARAAGGPARCSTPGIACQPGEIVCKAPAPQ